MKQSDTNVLSYLFPKESSCNCLIGPAPFVNECNRTFKKREEKKSDTNKQTDRRTSQPLD